MLNFFRVVVVKWNLCIYRKFSSPFQKQLNFAGDPVLKYFDFFLETHCM